MQSFKEINVDDTIYDSRTTINDSIKTVMSNNSGTAFPTTNLQVGMKCYRTDLGKTYTLTDVAKKTWKEDSHATIADSANKLNGYPVHDGGDSPFSKIPVISKAGVLEIGKYIDFHSANKQTTDVTTRITANDNGTISVSGGINANLNGNASSASSVPWTGVTGKPSTYPPSGHNHDSAYPATNGSRATGTWGINITGKANTAGTADNAIRANTATNVTQRVHANAVTDAIYPNNQEYLPDMSFMAYWNGAYQGTYSNLRYSNYGEIIGSKTIGNQSVNYANSAGSANAVAWGNVSSKPASIVKVASWDGSTLNLTTCT